MSVVLAKGGDRYSGETDDYPPDVIRYTKGSKEKKSHSHRKSRSVEPPLVTAARPYPRGSLLGDLLNPLHQAIHDTSMAVSRAPGDILTGTQSRGFSGQGQSSRGRRPSYSESDSDDSSSDSDYDRRGGGRRGRGGRGLGLLGSSFQDRRADRQQRIDERRADRGARREERRERKHGKVKKEERVVVNLGNIPSGRFRLILCFWDGQREVY